MTAGGSTFTRLSVTKQRLLAERRRTIPAAPPVPRRNPNALIEATHEQQALWFVDRFLGPGTNSAYNLYHALHLHGDLHVNLLQDCLRQVVDRHDALRTTFGAMEDASGGRLLLSVAPPQSTIMLPVREVGPRDFPAKMLNEALIPFDLTRGPLFRPVMFRLGDRDHVLLLSAHHIILDGASVKLVVGELARLYATRIAGRDDVPPRPPIEFADWAAYTHGEEHRTAVAERLEAAVTRLQGAPELLNLPTDRSQATRGESTEGDTVSAHIEDDVFSALRALCQSEGVTLFTAAMTVYLLLLSRWSGEQDICVGIPVARRGRAELAEVVGFFVGTGVVRTQVNAELTFRKLLSKVADAILEARADADVPFEQVVARLRPNRTLGRNPVFQAFLDVSEADLVAESGAGIWPNGITAKPWLLPVHEAKFDLSLAMIERVKGIAAELNYSVRLFGTTAARLLDQFVTLLEGLTTCPDIPVGDVSALSQADNERWHADGSGAVVAIPDVTLPQALAAVTAESANAVAVRAGDDDLSYAELDRRATALAQRLLMMGAGPGHTVAVAVPRSLDLAVALGAVLRAGAAYLPLDLDHPGERLRFMLDDARPVCVLTTSASASAFAGMDVPCIKIESEMDAGTIPEADSARRTLPKPHVLDAAYVIYTSGSTGRPKGVAVPHRGILNRLRWMQHAYQLSPGERVLQKTPITFDVSVWELFWPLLSHATIVFAPTGAHRDPLRLAQLVADERITTVHFVPSMLQAFLEEPMAAKTRGCLRRVFCSGEELAASTVARFADVLPDVELHNLYGPTEASVDVTAWKCGADDATAAPPIGLPIWNTCARVLDQRFRPVPVGAPGELYLSGVQLALGYYRRPGLTAERFLPDPFGSPGSRMYRTGDVVQRRQDGALVFLGRADQQVKLRGQRVELGEIEQVLRADSSVASAVVVVRENRAGVPQLVAYVTGTPDRPEPNGPALRARARAALPAVMVPEDVVVLDALPITTSGKLDRNALPAPGPTLSWTKQRLIAERRRPAATEGEDSEADDAPTNVLCMLFARLLGVDTVGPDDDFFRLGGDSIGSIRLVSLARRAGVGFSERMVFEHRTPRLLAAAAELTLQAPDAGPDEGTGVIPLTPIMRWWREGGGPAIGFHQSVLLDLPPGTSERMLIALLRALAERHDLLRARLTTDASGQEVLSVPPASAINAATWFTRVGARDPGDERALVASVAQSAASRLDPTRGLVDAVWIDHGHGRRGLLLLSVHHLAVDGVSWRVLLDDIVAAWDDAAAGGPVRLPEVATSFRTWARRVAREACEPARLAELDVWVRALTATEPGFGGVLDPVDTAGSVCEVVHELEAERAEPLLGAVPDRFRVGADHVLLCALALAVRAWRDRRGNPSALLKVMVEGHGRHNLRSEFDLSRTVGWFTVRHPAVLDLTGIDTVAALRPGPAAGAALRAVKEQLRALPDGGLGYGLLRYLSPTTRQTLATLREPEIAFNYLGRFRADATRHGYGVRIAGDPPALDGGVPNATPLTSVLDVTAIAWEQQGGVRLRTTFSWAPRVLKEPSVHELADLWKTALAALAGLVDDPDAGRATASDVFVDMGQDELDALQLEIESDEGER